MAHIRHVLALCLMAMGIAMAMADLALAGDGTVFELSGTPNPISVGDTVNLTATYNGSPACCIPLAMRIVDPADISTTIGSFKALTNGTPTSLLVSQQLNTAGPHTFHIYSDEGGESQPFGSDLIITVNKVDQTISFNSIADQILATATLGATATATSSLPVSFASSTPAVCTIAGGTISFVATGNCTITASQAGNFKYNAAPPVTRTFSVTGAPSLALTVTLNPAQFIASGQTIGASFLASNTGNVAVTSIAVIDSRASGVTCAATSLAAGASTACTGAFTTTAADVTAAGISTTATASGVFGNTAVSSAPATGAVTYNAPPRPPPQNSLLDQGANQNFMNDRGSVIVGVQPNQTNGDGRFAGSLFGGGTGGGGQPGTGGQGFVAEGLLPAGEIQTSSAFGQAVSIDGHMDDGTGQFSIGTSLNQLAAGARSNQRAREQDALGFGTTGLGSVKPGPYNMWAEVSATAFRNSGPGNARRGDVGIAFTGSDYLVNPGVLLGWVSQYDWSRESTDNGVSSTKGFGWMSGPYMALHLTQHLTLDARAAWGRSSNQTSPLGTYTDDFKTERTLLTGRLTGDWTANAWHFEPSAQIVHFQDKAEAYTNGLGVAVPGQTASLGQVTFGPRISYLARGENGVVAEPFVALKGVWTFDRSAAWSDTAGLVSGSAPFTGKIEAGAEVWFPSGVSLEGFGAFDSIGDTQAAAECVARS